MFDSNSPISPERWMAGVFSAKAVRDGQQIRRKLSSIEQYVGRDRFIAELKRRGWHAVENGEQLIIICNQEPIRVIL